MMGMEELLSKMAIHNLTLEGHKEDLKKYFPNARHRIIDGTMFIDMSSAKEKIMKYIKGARK